MAKYLKGLSCEHTLHIDMYLNLTSDIVLVGEIWSKAYNRTAKREFYVPRMRYRLQMSAPVFCAQNEELFDLHRAWASASAETNAQCPADAA